MGFEVDAINSVQFSNHTGYKVVKGQVLQEKELGTYLYCKIVSFSFNYICFVCFLVDLFDGLESNELLKCYSHLLTGYIGNASFLRQVAQIVKKLRATEPNLIYG